ncbi:APC family permease, partial [Gordonia aichiensis]
LLGIGLGHSWHPSRPPGRASQIRCHLLVHQPRVLYAVASWAVVLAFGSDNVHAASQADTANLVFNAAATFLGSAASDVMMVMLVTSLFAALLAFHNAIARYTFALARAGFGPQRFMSVHAKHGSPHAGSLLQTITAFLLVGVFAIAGADPVLRLFTWMSGVAIVAILVLMVLTSLAIIAYFRRYDTDNRVWHNKIAPVLGALGLIAITALVIANFTTLIGGSSVLANVFLVVVAAVFLGGFVAGRVLKNRAV